MTTKTAKIRILPSGAVEALSSNGHEVYHVSVGLRNSCDCPAGRNGRKCYHWTTAAERIATFWPAPKAWTRPANVTPLRPRPAASISDLYAS